MSAAPFMPLYVADYLADTVHLGATESGAYLHLLMGLWRHGGSLPDDDDKLRRMAKCDGRQWARIKGEVMPFFAIEGGVVSHRRVTSELTKYARKVDITKTAAAASVRAKSLKNQEPPSASAAQPELELEREQEKKEILPQKAPAQPLAPAVADAVSGEELFDQLWQASPITMRRRSSRAKARKAWAKLTKSVSPSLLLASLQRYRREDPDIQRTGGPGLHIWIEDGKWEHWLPSTTAPSPDLGEVTPRMLRDRLSHYADTGEWRDYWGPRPTGTASAA
ncbi:MAG: YdaU family protein [Candidatus Dormibacteria bacterium]